MINISSVDGLVSAPSSIAYSALSNLIVSLTSDGTCYSTAAQFVVDDGMISVLK